MFKYHIPTTYKIKKLRKKWNSNENLLFLDFDGVFFCKKEFPTTIGKRIDKLIEECTGIPVKIAEDAQSCVAVGTGKALNHIELLQTGNAMKIKKF